MIPSISVIIPTYNRKKRVIHAINSVLQQNIPHTEIIVVDDGSTDGTVSYLESLHLPIRIITQPNKGVSSARNSGIQKATGTHIALLDSDDVWLPTKLAKQLQFLTQNPEIQVIYTDQYLCIDGKILPTTRFQRNPPQSHLKYPAFVDYTPIHTSTVIIEKSVFDTIGYFDESLRIHEDSELWNRVSNHYTLGYIEEPLGIYYWESNQDHVTNTHSKQFVEDGLKYLELYVKHKNRELTPDEMEKVKESREILRDK